MNAHANIWMAATDLQWRRVPPLGLLGPGLHAVSRVGAGIGTLP